MFQSVNLHEFRDAFRIYNRTDNFSYEGLEVLFDHIEEIEDSTGEQIELDVIAFCVDFNELDLDEINQDYQQSFETLEEAEEWLNDQTMVAGTTDNSIVFQAF